MKSPSLLASMTSASRLASSTSVRWMAMSTTFSSAPPGQRHGPEADGRQRLHERHRQIAVGGQEEQAGGRLVPGALGELQQPVPAGPLVRLRAPAQDR